MLVLVIWQQGLPPTEACIGEDRPTLQAIGQRRCVALNKQPGFSLAYQYTVLTATELGT